MMAETDQLLSAAPHLLHKYIVPTLFMDFDHPLLCYNIVSFITLIVFAAFFE